MLRAIVAMGLGLVSIGCAAETYAESADPGACDWAVIWLGSVGEEAGDCEWSIRSLDTSVSRVRSFSGSPSGEVVTCGIATYERIDGLRPDEAIEIWSPGDTDPDISRAAVEQSACR